MDEHAAVADAGGEDPIEVDTEVGLELVEEGFDEADVVVARAPVALARLATLGRGRIVEGPVCADRSLGAR